MNSADAWYEDEETRHADDLEALLGLSVELVDTMNRAKREVEMNAEAIKRHPSGKVVIPGPGPVVVPEGATDVLTAADRCDAGCGAAALYRIEKDVFVQPEGYAQPHINVSALEFCHHHGARHIPGLTEQGWKVVGTNPGLMQELYANRLKGADHA